MSTAAHRVPGRPLLRNARSTADLELSSSLDSVCGLSIPHTVSNRVLKAVSPGACAPGSGIAPWSRADAGDPRRRRDAVGRAASLCHYFAGRHQVGAELVQRHLTEVDARLTAALNNPKLRTLHDTIDGAIDPYLAYFRKHPDFIQLWVAGRNRCDASV